MNHEFDLPKISIVMPSYNQAGFLENSIHSVLSQDYPNKELILIDGGSTDGSLAIIQSHQDQLAYWVSEKDRGQSHAINKGFEHCTGDLITFLSSDDCYLPGALQFVAEKYLSNPDCGAVVGGFRFMNEKGQLVQETIPPRLPHTTPCDFTLIPPGDWRLHQVSTFYTRHALDSVGRYVHESLHYVMDRELLFRVAGQFEIVLDERAYAAFRRHPESKSMSAGIPFNEEFAQLYLDAKNGKPRNDHFKEKVARFFRAKGYLHFAKYHTEINESKKAIKTAIEIFPQIVLRKPFLVQMIKFLIFRNKKM